MGHSYTIHCLGIPSGTAMNRVEIAQSIYKAEQEGHSIKYWYPQTKTGERILRTSFRVTTEELRSLLPQLVTCPICEGEGRNGRYYCPICNGSGITKPGNEKNWQPWQLEHMRQCRTNDQGV